jgi:hypothetical protein
MSAKTIRTHWAPSPTSPGPITDQRTCPTPNEIVCIYVQKIYDACSQRDCEEFTFDTDKPVARFVSCQIVPGSVKAVHTCITQFDTGPLARVDATICAEVSLTYIATDGTEITIVRSVAFKKAVLLYAPDPANFDYKVLTEAVFECLSCRITSEGDLACFIGAFIIIKVSLFVQLLVPSFGFCPVPVECEELPDQPNICIEFETRPFPEFFPPQQ